MHKYTLQTIRALVLRRLGFGRWSTRLASRVILGAAALIVAVVLVRIQLSFRRSSIFPTAGDRVDVTEIHIAAMDAVCPDAAATLKVADMETCLKTLTLADGQRSAAFKAVHVPRIDQQFGDEIPELPQLLQTQGLTETRDMLKALRPFIVGFRLPGRLFRPNKIGADLNVLTFAGLQDGRVCFDGACPYVVQRFDANALPFPLVWRDDALPKGDVDIFIFAQDPKYPLGILTQDGIFATPFSQLYPVRKLYPALLYGRAVVLAMVFIGLFLMASGFAITWAEFADYGAFCYLTASLALLTLVSQKALGDFGSYTNYIRVSVWSWLNFFFASTAFALATNRIGERRLLRFFGGGILATTFLVMIMPTDSTLRLAAAMRIFMGAASVGVAILPPAVALWGARSCWRRYKSGQGGPLSVLIDFRRRTIEQCAYAAILLLTGIQLLSSYLVQANHGGDAVGFAPSAGLLLLLTFAVILYHSTAKLAKTHFRTDGQSEATRLKGRLGTRRYLAWLAEQRQGVMLQVDLKNSSVAAGVLKSRIHLLMQRLYLAMLASHKELGYHWILSKKNGNEWIVILAQKHASLQDDLTEVTDATKVDATIWKRLVQAMAPECSIHVNIFALGSYTLSAGNEEQSTLVRGDGTWDVVDFASREANYLMKWAGKSRRTDSLTVGGAAPITGGIVPSMTEETIKLSKVIAQAGEVSPENVFDAESMNLIYAFVPWQESEGSPTDLAAAEGLLTFDGEEEEETSGDGLAS